MGTFTFKWSVANSLGGGAIGMLRTAQEPGEAVRDRQCLASRTERPLLGLLSTLFGVLAVSGFRTAIAPPEPTEPGLLTLAGLTRLRRCTLPAPSTAGPRARSSKRSAITSRRPSPSQKPAMPSSTRFVLFRLHFVSYPPPSFWCMRQPRDESSVRRHGDLVVRRCHIGPSAVGVPHVGSSLGAPWTSGCKCMMSSDAQF